MFGVEDSTGDVVEVATTGVDLPRLHFTHPPQFDLPVIRSRYNEGKCGVEDSIIDPPVMALKDILDR